MLILGMAYLWVWEYQFNFTSPDVSDTRTVKKIFNWKRLTKRSQGRPKYRWKDNIKQDIYQMKIKTG